MGTAAVHNRPEQSTQHPHRLFLGIVTVETRTHTQSAQELDSGTMKEGRGVTALLLVANGYGRWDGTREEFHGKRKMAQVT